MPHTMNEPHPALSLWLYSFRILVVNKQRKQNSLHVTYWFLTKVEDNGTMSSKFWVSFNLEFNSMLHQIIHDAGEEEKNNIFTQYDSLKVYLPCTLSQEAIAGHAPPKWGSDSRQMRIWVQEAGEGQREWPLVAKEDRGVPQWVG